MIAAGERIPFGVWHRCIYQIAVARHIKHRDAILVNKIHLARICSSKLHRIDVVVVEWYDDGFARCIIQLVSTLIECRTRNRNLLVRRNLRIVENVALRIIRTHNLNRRGQQAQAEPNHPDDW